MFLKTITFAGAFALLGSSAIADCGISGGNVSILSNDFPAIQAVTAEAAKCAGNGVTIETSAFLKAAVSARLPIPPETPTHVRINKSKPETGIFQSPNNGIVTNEAIIPNMVKYSATK